MTASPTSHIYLIKTKSNSLMDNTKVGLISLIK